MAKVVKELFLSKNYLVIDTPIDCELVFAPIGDGTTGGDVMKLRGGRWAFRIADFIIGAILPNGSREQIGSEGKGYKVNCVYDDSDLEEGKAVDYFTTYRNPAEITALDGQLVEVSGLGSSLVGVTTRQDKVESFLNDKSEGSIDNSGYSDDYNLKGLLACIMGTISSAPNHRPPMKFSDIYLMLANQHDAVCEKIVDINDSLYSSYEGESKSVTDYLRLIFEEVAGDYHLGGMIENINGDADSIRAGVDDLNSTASDILYRFRGSDKGFTVSLGGNIRYAQGTIFFFGPNRFISLNVPCITVPLGNNTYCLLGDLTEYDSGDIKRIDGVVFNHNACTKVLC